LLLQLLLARLCRLLLLLLLALLLPPLLPLLLSLLLGLLLAPTFFLLLVRLFLLSLPLLLDLVLLWLLARLLALLPPLRSPLNIQMYNNMWFPSSLPTDHPPLDAPPSSTFPLPAVSIPAAAALPVCVSNDPPITSIHTSGASLHDVIALSSDRLFFVSYRPAGTLRPRWYLVQVDLPQSLDASANFASDGRYCCHFLGRHPDDTSLPDPSSCWWLLWHRFTISSDDVIEFGARVLFNPITNPNPASYIAWADVLPLLDPSNP
jgi:hypothetical protein